MKSQPEIPLRRLTLRDAAELFAVVDANREHLRTCGCTCVTDTRQFLLDVSNQYSRNLGCQYAIIQAKRIVGVAGFHPINWQSQQVALGYWPALAVDPPYTCA